LISSSVRLIIRFLLSLFERVVFPPVVESRLLLFSSFVAILTLLVCVCVCSDCSACVVGDNIRSCCILLSNFVGLVTLLLTDLNLINGALRSCPSPAIKLKFEPDFGKGNWS
jgi:hypothetical protein